MPSQDLLFYEALSNAQAGNGCSNISATLNDYSILQVLSNNISQRNRSIGPDAIKRSFDQVIFLKYLSERFDFVAFRLLSHCPHSEILQKDENIVRPTLSFKITRSIHHCRTKNMLLTASVLYKGWSEGNYERASNNLYS